jgi:preprotein translocase subunit SecD
MRKQLRWRLFAVVSVVIVAGALVWPPSETVRLGLDLRGGVHLVLQVQTDEGLELEAETEARRLREEAELAGMSLASVEVLSPTDLVVSGVPAKRDAEFRRLAGDLLTSYDRLSASGGVHRYRLRPAIERTRREETARQARLTISRRIEAFGVAEPVIAPHGTAGDQIVVQLPGVADVDGAKAVIRSTGVLELNLVEGGPAPSRTQLLQTTQGVLAANREVVPGIDPGLGDGGSDVFYLVRRPAPISGRDLRYARPTLDELDRPAIGFSLNRDGARSFGALTSANVGRDLAVVLDGRVQSVAVIEEPITGGEGRIHGTFTSREASDLALILRSGALPASLAYLEERTIGASLGADSIRAGLTASVAGLIAVALFLLCYYRLSGVNAVVAIVLNLLLLVAGIAAVGTELTLPGIAGLILTIGMGVDSNVLIFERIKEELRVHTGIRAAVAAGFDRVFLTILDTHIASLIAAAFLFQFGSGPIRGFATTLFFGLVSNVFTAVFVSRTLFGLVLTRKRGATLSI